MLPKEEPTVHRRVADERRVIAWGTALLGTVAAGGLLYLRPVRGQPPTSVAMVAGITLLFAVAALRPVALRFGDHALLVTVREVPLVLGLYLASPRQVLVACALGSTIALFESWHGHRAKAFFNIAHSTAEAGVFLVVTCAITTPVLVDTARSLPALFVGIAAKELFAAVTLGEVLIRLGRSTSRRKTWRGSVAASISAFAWAAVAIVIVQLVRVSAFALVPFIVVITAVLFAQRAALRSDARAQQTAQVYTLAKMLAEHPYTPTQLDLVAETAREILQTRRLDVVILDAARAAEGRVHTFEYGAHPVVQQLDFAAAGPVGEVLVQGIPKLVSRNLEWTLPDDVRDALIAPLRNEEGVFGTIAAYNRIESDARFAQPDLDLLTAMASHVAAWLDNAQLITRLRAEITVRSHQAQHDSLTNLRNRDAFIMLLDDAIERTKADGTEGAVLILNIENLREINDAFGHESGDEAVRHVAEALRTTLPSDVGVARVGSDAFAVLLRDEGDPTELRRFAAGILDALCAPVLMDTVLVIVETSIGIAVFPRHAITSGQVLQRADIAMLRARQSASRIEFATQVEEVATRERLQLVADVRNAIENGEISVALQPKIDMLDNTVIGAEALARWMHPTRGPVSPQVFSPLVEQSGLIGQLTIHVLRTALHEALQIREHIPEFGVAVNLSMRNLLDARLTTQVRDLLAAADFPPGALTLEVTESFVMNDLARASRQLNELHDLGVRISVDDFGTGQSSLAYLAELPIQELKIDQGFVAQLPRSTRDRAIVASIIDLGRNLGLDVVAEGVETASSMKLLRDLGCLHAQGYAISPALPAAELLEWYQARTSLPAATSSIRQIRQHRRNHPSM